MKCTACGYKYEQDFINGNKSLNYIMSGDDPFINIIGSFHIQSGVYNDERPVKIMACPKCKTVILNDR